MQTRVRALGHPVHQMLVVFPLGLLVTGTVFDLIHIVSDNGTFAEVGFWMISAGIIGAVLAALTGFADWTSIPRDTRAKRVGALHGALNAVVLVLFAISWLVRVGSTNHAAGGGAFTLEVIAVAIGGASAWLGGELVDRLGIGVHEDANPDAPARCLAPAPGAPRLEGPAPLTRDPRRGAAADRHDRCEWMACPRVEQRPDKQPFQVRGIRDDGYHHVSFTFGRPGVDRAGGERTGRERRAHRRAKRRAGAADGGRTGPAGRGGGR
ncbi:DUF2231 domain-containing protein [Micromonospora sp. CPCC 206061]|uniref:DUF2231 domain-containing protein n=1 Tax=Micromonospora sp. CPCC 206061 TaxID=3122410 RepID=UPI002FF27642